MLLGLHQNAEDEVPIVALRVLVDRAVVRTVLAVVKTFRAAQGKRDTCEVNHRHWHEELLRLTLVELPLLAVPAATLDEETVDILALFRYVLDLFQIVRQDLTVRNHIIKGPLVLLVLPRHLLPHTSQEALRIREPGEPIALHCCSAVLKPSGKQIVTVDETREPASHIRQEPRDFLPASVMGPSLRHTRIEDRVEVIEKLFGHHNGPVDRHGQVLQIGPHDSDDALEPLQLLEEEDVQRRQETLVGRVRRTLELVDLLAENLFDEIRRHLDQGLLALLLDDVVRSHASIPTCVLRLGIHDGRNHHRRLNLAVRQICVRMQAEDQRRVHRREGVDVITVCLDLEAFRNLVVEVSSVVVEGEPSLEDVVVEPLGHVCIEELTVQVVGDAASVLHLADHVLHCRPRYRKAHGNRGRQITLEEVGACIKVRAVVLVRHAPPDRAELPALLHDRVLERENEEEQPPLFVIDLVEDLLRDERLIGTAESSLKPLRRLERHLDCHLEQTNREAGIDLASNPEAEVLDNIGRVPKDVLHTLHKPDTQVAVLQDHPGRRDEAELHLLVSNNLLPFAHGDVVRRELLLLLRKLADHRRRVGPRGQEVKNWHAIRRLVIDVLDKVRHRLCKLSAELQVDELRAGDHRTVLAHAAHEGEANERSEGFLHNNALLVIGDGAALRLVLVVPLPPNRLVAGHKIDDLAVEKELLLAERMPRQRQDVQPHLIQHPLERARPLLLDIL